MLDTKSILSEKMLIPLCMGTFRDRWGTTGLVREVEGRISIIWYLCTKMVGLEMGCGRRVTVTIEFGLLSFLNFTRNLKNLKCFFVTINRIRIVGIPTKCKKTIQSCITQE